MKNKGMHFDPHLARAYEQLKGMFGGTTASRFAVPEEFAPAPAADVPAAPDLMARGVAALLAGRAGEALEALRPLVFAGDSTQMNHESPLAARVAFVQALWLAGNTEGVQQHLSALPEQNDPRVQALTRQLAAWQKSFTFAQRTGFKKKPPLPPLGDRLMHQKGASCRLGGAPAPESRSRPATILYIW